MSVLELSGLTSFRLDLYSRVMNDYFKQIHVSNFVSDIDCVISIKNIKLTNSFNCNVQVENKCFKNESTSLQIFYNVLYENRKFIDEELGKAFKEKMGIDFNAALVSNVENLKFVQDCSIVNANVENRIEIENINISNCFSKEPMTMVFLNTGNANVNCAISSFINVIGTESSTDKDPPNKRLYVKKIFDFSLNYVLWFVVFMFVLFFYYFCVKHFTTPYKKIVCGYKINI